MEMNIYTYEKIQEICNFLLKRTKHRPTVGLVLGTGFGGVAESLTDVDCFKYEDIPDFPVSTVPGHEGRLIFGHLKGVSIICFQGRFHIYEGYSTVKCAMPIRVMKLIGVETVILTNASGGINEEYKVGDLMVMEDHINLPGFVGETPLKGKNDERWGPRFPDLTNLYDVDLRRMSRKLSVKLGMDHFIREGVYLMVAGPSYETVAELRLMKIVGADTVGMSTVHEAITARHCGIKVFAVSLVSNMCSLKYEYDNDNKANHEEVLETAEKRKNDMKVFFEEFVANLDSCKINGA